MNINLYFTKQAKSNETKSTFAYPLARIAEYLHSLPQPLHVYFYSSRWSYSYETLRFLAYDISGEDRSPQSQINVLGYEYPAKNIVYIFLPEYSESFHSIQRLYPNGKALTKKDKDGSILFFAYILPKSI